MPESGGAGGRREPGRAWHVSALLAALLVLALPLALARVGVTLELGAYALAGTFVLTDTLDLLVRLYVRRLQTRLAASGQRTPETSVPLDIGRFSPYQMRLHLRPFAIVAAVYNLGGRVDAFVARLGRHRARLWVADDASSDGTADELERAGIRCLRVPTNRKKPGALRELLRKLPPEIATVVVIDPDVGLDDPAGTPGELSSLERVVFEFQRSGMAAACPRIVVSPDGLLSDFQYLEYALALEVGRKGLGDHCVTSGASIYRRDALETALSAHSLSVYAEDLSNALILLGADERIYYDGRLTLRTEGQRSLGALFSQRVGWAFGLLHVYARDLRLVVKAAGGRPFLVYHFLAYTGVMGLLLHPLRVAALALLALSLLNGADNLLGLGLVPDGRWSEPSLALLAWFQYTLLTVAQSFVALRPGERRRALRVAPLYFPYAVLQTVPNTVGYLNWFWLLLFRRRLYRDHYQSDEALIRRQMCGSH